jgi:protease-4
LSLQKIKPVVVSMGNYAASGGYYIACNAHKIFAEKYDNRLTWRIWNITFSQLTNRIGFM